MFPRWFCGVLCAWIAWSGKIVIYGQPAPEKLILLPVGGDTLEDREIARWQARARDEHVTIYTLERLGWAFVGKARRTVDAGYYKLAEATADTMEARFGASAESRLLRGHVLHQLHRFAEAEAVARLLVTERGLAYDYGLLSDVLMEQGRITEAVAACQEMMNRRPGLEANARSAHLRWLTGDVDGAIAAMEAAVASADSRSTEAVAWALSRLSGYSLQKGEVARSLALAESALRRAADYPPALLAQGRAAWALGQQDLALNALRQAAQANPLPEYQWWLVDALRAAGPEHDREAATVEAKLHSLGAASDPRTYAVYLATRGDEAAGAVALAQAELADRQDPFTHDAVAWALWATGEQAEAEKAMERAMHLGTQDARLFLHAGIVAAGQARTTQAAVYFAQAESMRATLTPGEQALLARHRTSSVVSDESVHRTPASSPEARPAPDPGHPSRARL